MVSEITLNWKICIFNSLKDNVCRNAVDKVFSKDMDKLLPLKNVIRLKDFLTTQEAIFL